jgi:hypothetical protein
MPTHREQTNCVIRQAASASALFSGCAPKSIQPRLKTTSVASAAI